MLIEITSTEVKSTETFVFSALYDALHEYMIEEGYAGDNDKFPETYYWESRTQQKGREYWIWWRFNQGTATSFCKKHIDIDIHGAGVKDIEIMYQNKKIKANKGKLEIIIRGKLEVDPDDKWKNSRMGFLRDIFFKRMWQKQRDEHKADLIDDLERIRAFVADFLNKPISREMPEPFQPRMGYEREKF